VNIHFVGFVNLPGVHMVHPFSNVISGLIQAGGVDKKGTLRDIKIIRNNNIIGSIDIYNYLIKGGSIDDIRLMDQDIVYVSARKSTIPITGRILRPGYYEILEREKLSDLINFSGGLDRRSSKYIFLYKNGKSTKDGFMIFSDKTSNFFISQNDSIHIPLRPDFQSFVNIQGQIKNPGEYPYNEKMKLKDLLDATMSLDDNNFFQTMDLSKINIFRRNPSSSEPINIITQIDENIALENGDYITIPMNNLFKPIETIKIYGEIKTPRHLSSE
jgi:Periplasmic protein involved in polysaccharide export